MNTLCFNPHPPLLHPSFADDLFEVCCFMGNPRCPGYDGVLVPRTNWRQRENQYSVSTTARVFQFQSWLAIILYCIFSIICFMLSGAFESQTRYGDWVVRTICHPSSLGPDIALSVSLWLIRFVLYMHLFSIFQIFVTRIYQRYHPNVGLLRNYLNNNILNVCRNKLHHTLNLVPNDKAFLGPLLLTWFNFNPSMDK